MLKAARKVKNSITRTYINTEIKIQVYKTITVVQKLRCYDLFIVQVENVVLELFIHY